METQKGKEGIYEEHEIVNGKKSWKSSSHAIWFSLKCNNWAIGNLDKIGSDTMSLKSKNDTGDFGYPYDVPNDKWQYCYNSGWNDPTDCTDIMIKSVKGMKLLFVTRPSQGYAAYK